VSTPAIETAGLTKFYGGTRGIEDLDLRVEHGEIFGYLGPNGAGKTTTIRLLLDLIRPTGGSAAIAGLDSRQRSVEVRELTGYLPGELKLPPRSTANGFIAFLARLRGGVDRRAPKAAPSAMFPRMTPRVMPTPAPSAIPIPTLVRGFIRPIASFRAKHRAPACIETSGAALIFVVVNAHEGEATPAGTKAKPHQQGCEWSERDEIVSMRAQADDDPCSPCVHRALH
jgi:hypothetical protein